MKISKEQLFKMKASWFDSVVSTKPKPITIGKWLENCIDPKKQFISFADKCRNMRTIENKQGITKLKKQLPAISLGASLTTRDASVPAQDRIIAANGLIQIDIDAKENPHISNFEKLRDELSKVVYVAYSSISASGRGVYALIKVSSPSELKAHRKQLQRDFESIGIFIDTTKGKNLMELRYYSYDSNAIISDSFLEYDRKAVEIISKPTIDAGYRLCYEDSNSVLFEKGLVFATNRVGSFSEGNRHSFISMLCIFLNCKGVEKEVAKTLIDSKLIPLTQIKSNCIEGPYKTYTNQFGAWK